MFKYYSSYTLLWIGLTHLLCCGLPLTLSFVSLSSNALFLDSLLLNTELLEAAEPYLFAITTLIFLLIISFEIYNKKIKYQGDECCTEQECSTTNKKIKINLILASVLYALNSSIFLSEVIL